MRSIFTSIFFFTLFITTSCTKEVETYESEPVTDYVPMQTGKYITYRLDSTIFTNFGTTTIVNSYQERHTVEAQIPDAMGRPSYRIQRSIRNLSGTSAWQPSGSYFITIADNKVEVIEDNLRFVKLVQPIKEDLTWYANKYLPSKPFSKFSFSIDGSMVDWESRYKNIGETVTLNSLSLSNVITVESVDDTVNVPITSTQLYAFKTYSLEKYAKGIGMVFQEFIIWEYQRNPSPNTVGFGVKRSIMDRN